MHIYGPAHLHGAHSANAPHTSRVSKPASTTQSQGIQDELQLSDAAQLIEETRDVPDIRYDRVAQIRAEIAAGTYETDEKLEMAVGRLLDEIG